MTLRDLLDRQEFRRLYDLVDVKKARASKQRSNSICGQLSQHEFFKHRVRYKKNKGLKEKRPVSVEYGTKNSVDKRLNQIEINFLDDNHFRKVRNNEMSEMDWRRSLLSDKEVEETNSFRARDIKQPEVYVMGAKSISSQSESAENKKNQDHIFKKQLKNPYFNIESKLRAYIKNNRPVPVERGPVSLKKPKFAINRHQISTGPFIVYKDMRMNKKKKIDDDSYLKVGNNLKNLIREDLKVNRGWFLKDV